MPRQRDDDEGDAVHLLLGPGVPIDGPRQRRVQLEKPILLAVAMLLCVFVLARQGTAALASAVHVNRGVPAAQLAQDARLDSERRRIVESSEANATGAT